MIHNYTDHNYNLTPLQNTLQMKKLKSLQSVGLRISVCFIMPQCMCVCVSVEIAIMSKSFNHNYIDRTQEETTGPACVNG